MNPKKGLMGSPAKQGSKGLPQGMPGKPQVKKSSFASPAKESGDKQITMPKRG